MSAVLAATSRSPWARGVLLAAVLAIAAVLQLTGANPATSQTATITALRVDEGPGVEPDEGIWDRVPTSELSLTAQQTTYPFGGGSVPSALVQGVHDGEDLYLRIRWDDPTSDVGSGEPQAYADAMAVQFPSESGASVPSVCMGQADGGVNIWQWRADSDSGIPQTAEDLGPNAAVDVEPGDELDYPARAAGNPLADPDAGAVHNLLAEGFGTIGPAEEQPVGGAGDHDGGEWTVVVRRPLAVDGEGQPTFETGAESDVALAIWNGHEQDRNGQKSVSAFAQLELSDEGVPGPGSRWVIPIIGLMFVVALFVLVRGGFRRAR